MVTVRAPATTANLGPGFDCLGMALDLHNYISMEIKPRGLTIEVEGEGEQSIPLDHNNIVYRAAEEVFNTVGSRLSGLAIKLKNNIPVARGLGSSAAAIVGGLVAANYLTGNKLSQVELLQLATAFEGHPDNVAPAIFGGIVIAARDEEIVYHRFSSPPDLKVIVAIPEFTLSTQKARSVLPSEVRLTDAVFNVARMGLLVSAFATGDLNLLTEGMHDRLHQPYRSKLIPGMNAVFTAAKQAGALAVALSGAGPTLIAFAKQKSREIAGAMSEEFERHGIAATALEIKPEENGAVIFANGGKEERCHL